MDRRNFTYGLAAGALAGLAGDAFGQPVPYTGPTINLVDDDQIDVLRRLDLGPLARLIADLPPVRPSDFNSEGRQTQVPRIRGSSRGIALIVTPQITGGGEIGLHIDAKVTNIDRPLVTRIADAAGAPHINDPSMLFEGNVRLSGDPAIIVTRRTRTTVLVEDKQTIVINGLIHDVPNQSENEGIRVPFLADLPVIGHAFRRLSPGNQHSELVIFITPTLAPNPRD